MLFPCKNIILLPCKTLALRNRLLISYICSSVNLIVEISQQLSAGCPLGFISFHIFYFELLLFQLEIIYPNLNILYVNACRISLHLRGDVCEYHTFHIFLLNDSESRHFNSINSFVIHSNPCVNELSKWNASDYNSEWKQRPIKLQNNTLTMNE